MFIRHVWLMVIAMLWMFAVTTSSALAHARLISSNPANGAILSAPPDRVVLVFSEELKPDGNLITVTDASGRQVDRGDTALDLNDPKRATLTVSLQGGLGNGAYTVQWRNMSTDGHSEQGQISFSVGAAPAPLPATGADRQWPLIEALALAAALLVAGTLLRRQQA
ncbi:MAG: copper resistance protein CopC [Oscillochloridaceae bacterium]|nr:copper resistance protein CopC [Chloroflexaceae bacterium]MDW8391460.1 copper resistance protein CopC [Oscillochloridaceae bacterium]